MTAPTLTFTRPRWQQVGLKVLTVLLALAFLGAAFGKLSGAAPMVATFEGVGLGQWFRYVTGALELVLAIGLLIPKYTRLAALGLVVVMIGAVVAHIARLHSPFIAPAVLGLLAAVVWRAHRTA